MHGETEAIKAASERGYEAILLVMVVIAMMTLFGLIMRWFLHATTKQSELAASREKQLGDKLAEIDTFIRGEVIQARTQNATALADAARAMESAARVSAVMSKAVMRLADTWSQKPCAAGMKIEQGDPMESVVV